MKNIDREDVYKAVFDQISSVAEFKVKSRRFKSFDEMNPGESPAIYMLQNKEVPVQEKHFPTKWFLQVNFFIYINTGADKNRVPSTQLNQIIDALEVKLRPELSKQVQTLGINGVSHVWIAEDGIDYNEGVLDNVAIAIIPVNILAI